MIAVVIKARRRKKGKKTVKSQCNVEGEPLEAKVSTDNVDTYDYIRDQPTPRPRQDEIHNMITPLLRTPSSTQVSICYCFLQHSYV